MSSYRYKDNSLAERGKGRMTAEPRRLVALAAYSVIAVFGFAGLSG